MVCTSVLWFGQLSGGGGGDCVQTKEHCVSVYCVWDYVQTIEYYVWDCIQTIEHCASVYCVWDCVQTIEHCVSVYCVWDYVQTIEHCVCIVCGTVYRL